MPATAKRISQQMNAPLTDFSVLEECAAKKDTKTASALYPSGNQVTGTPEILCATGSCGSIDKVNTMFAERRAAAGISEDGTAVDGQGTADGNGASDADEKPVDLEAKAEITYDDFDKCQFQVGLVLSCEEVPKSKKLLKFEIQVGSAKRQILSGIKQYYKPEELVGKRVMVLTNLKPREIAGMMSEGMILSAADEDGNLAVMTPERFMPTGAEIC